MASVFPLVRLTSAPDTTATTLFDFNSVDSIAGGAHQSCRVQSDGWTLDVPKLLGDPDSIFPQYGERVVGFTTKIKGPKAYALGKISAAARWLLRDNVWLMVQLNAVMKPVWFKLYRPQPGELSFDNIFPGVSNNLDNWAWQVQLPAEPFAYGPKVSWGPITINNDPASGTNPCSYVLPAITGDAPAPLTVDIVPSVSWAECQPFMATVAHDAGTSPSLIVWQTGGLTAGTDTTASTADAAYSGGSRSTITFATNANMVTRLSGNAPSTPAAGRYRVLVRAARSDTTTTFAARFGQAFGLGATQYGDTKRMVRTTSPTSGYTCLLDMGEHTFPIGSEGFSPAEVGTPPTPSILLDVQRLSGSGSVYIDAIILIPIQTSTMYSIGQSRAMFTRLYNAEINASRNGIWDADKERFRAMNFGIQMVGFQPWLRGTFMEVVPGAVNMFHLHHQIDGDDPFFLPATSDNKDVLTATADVRFSYYPRLLYIGDGS